MKIVIQKLLRVIYIKKVFAKLYQRTIRWYNVLYFRVEF